MIPRIELIFAPLQTWLDFIEHLQAIITKYEIIQRLPGILHEQPPLTVCKFLSHYFLPAEIKILEELQGMSQFRMHLSMRENIMESIESYIKNESNPYRQNKSRKIK